MRPNPSSFLCDHTRFILQTTSGIFRTLSLPPKLAGDLQHDFVWSRMLGGWPLAFGPKALRLTAWISLLSFDLFALETPKAKLLKLARRKVFQLRFGSRRYGRTNTQCSLLAAYEACNPVISDTQRTRKLQLSCSHFQSPNTCPSSSHRYYPTHRVTTFGFLVSTMYPGSFSKFHQEHSIGRPLSIVHLLHRSLAPLSNTSTSLPNLATLVRLFQYIRSHLLLVPSTGSCAEFSPIDPSYPGLKPCLHLHLRSLVMSKLFYTSFQPGLGYL